MPTVESLTSEVNRLNQCVGFWNTAIIVLMVGVAVVATGLVISQQMAFRRAGALAVATEELSKLKEGISDQKIAEANKKAGEANERAANSEKTTAELLQKIQPRRLSSKEIGEIAKALKPFSGTTVGVATYSQDTEAMILGGQIKDALGKAGIIVFDMIGRYNAMGVPIYTGVVVDADSSDKKLTLAVSKALGSEGKLATVVAPVRFGEGSRVFAPPGGKEVVATVFVGGKPIQ